MSLEDAEAVRVKEEPDWEDNSSALGLQVIDGSYTVKVEWESEAAPLANLDTEHKVKQEVESKASTLSDHIKHEVKLESEGDGQDCYIYCNMDKTRTNKKDVYTDHSVKEVLVVPELQQYKQLLASRELTKEENSLQSKPIREKLYKCDHCSYATHTAESLQLHEKIHYVCVYCKYTAASEVSLMLHVRTHASEKPKTYARRTYGGPKQRGQGARAGLYTKQQVKEEPLNEAGTQDRVIEHEVKVEPESGVRSQAGQIEEQERASEEGAAGLYTGDAVKEELVVVSEEVHRPEQLLGNEGSTKRKESIEQLKTKSEMNGNLLILHSTRLAEKSYELNDSAYKDPLKKNEKVDTGKIYNCIYCRYTNSNKNILQNHQRKHIGEPFKCIECNFVCAHRSQLKAHKCIHFEKPHKCTHCSYASENKYELRIHQMKHTGEKVYKCAYCSYATAIKDHILVHETIHTGKKKYKCSDCSYKTNNIVCLNAHERRHETCKETYTCAHCTYTTVTKIDLTNHVKTHMTEKPYKCVHCSFASAHRQVLKDHLNTHNVKYRCAHCSFASVYKRCLVIHIRTHSDKKPYKCTQCAYSGSHKGHLKLHLLTHNNKTEMKIHKCAKCSYTTSYEFFLEAHEKAHSIAGIKYNAVRKSTIVFSGPQRT